MFNRLQEEKGRLERRTFCPVNGEPGTSLSSTFEVLKSAILFFLTTLLQNAKYETSERARIHSLGRSLFLPSLGRRLLFVLPLTNAQLRKMSSSGSASVKHNEIIMR